MSSTVKTKDDSIRDRLYKAGIKVVHRKQKLPDLGKGGVALREYLTTDSYKEDKENGTGLLIYGKGAMEGICVFAKELVLAGDNVKLLHLNTLKNWLNKDDEKLYDLDHTGALCITWFNLNNVDCPLTPAEMFDVQAFITDRSERGYRNYLSSDVELKQMQWWPEGWGSYMANYLREVNFGSIKNRN